MHQVLKSIGCLQIIDILGIDDLEDDLLEVSLVGLVLNDLTELYSVYFGGDQSLKFVEETLLLSQYWL